MKRRAAIELSLKRGQSIDCNRIKGRAGDRINVILNMAGMNFCQAAQVAAAFLRIFFSWLFGCQRVLLVSPTV